MNNGLTFSDPSLKRTGTRRREGGGEVVVDVDVEAVRLEGGEGTTEGMIETKELLSMTETTAVLNDATTTTKAITGEASGRLTMNTQSLGEEVDLDEDGDEAEAAIRNTATVVEEEAGSTEATEATAGVSKVHTAPTTGGIRDRRLDAGTISMTAGGVAFLKRGGGGSRVAGDADEDEAEAVTGTRGTSAVRERRAASEAT